MKHLINISCDFNTNIFERLSNTVSFNSFKDNQLKENPTQIIRGKKTEEREIKSKINILKFQAEVSTKC